MCEVLSLRWPIRLGLICLKLYQSLSNRKFIVTILANTIARDSHHSFLQLDLFCQKKTSAASVFHHDRHNRIFEYQNRCKKNENSSLYRMCREAAQTASYNYLVRTPFGNLFVSDKEALSLPLSLYLGLSASFTIRCS